MFLGVEPSCLFESTDGGDTWAPVEGFLKHEHREKWTPGNGGLCMHTILPDPGFGRPHAGGVLHRRRLPHRRRRRVVAPPQPRRARRVPAGQAPGVRPVRAQGGAPPDPARAALPAEPLGAVPERRLGRLVAGHRQRGARRTSASPWPCTPTTPTPSTSCPWRATTSDARRRRSCGSTAPGTPARRGSRCPRGSPRRMPTRRCSAMRWTPTAGRRAGVYFGTRSGKVYASADGGDSWALVQDGLPPVVCVKAEVLA